jgi:hypothetical protein
MCGTKLAQVECPHQETFVGITGDCEVSSHVYQCSLHNELVAEDSLKKQLTLLTWGPEQDLYLNHTCYTCSFPQKNIVRDRGEP